MKVHIDIDYGLPEKNFQMSAEADEYRFPADRDVRELYEVQRLLTETYERAMAALQAMHKQAMDKAEEKQQQATKVWRDKETS